MMDLLTGIAEFLGEADRWSFTDGEGIPYRVLEHLGATAVAMVIAALFALPPALWLAHHRRAEALSSAIVNIGRAIPSFGLIVLFFLLFSVRLGVSSFWALIAALVALAIPPVFTNAYTGIAGVTPATVEAAVGQGLTDRQVLAQVEIPLATPVILAGVRIALVQVIATVGIGAIVTDGGGLGRFVIDGFAKGPGGHAEVFVGAVLLAVLVLAAEGAFGSLEERVVPGQVRSDVSDAEDVLRSAGAA